MKLKNGILIVIAFILMLCVIYIASLDVSNEESGRGFTDISVIIRETNSDTYETIRQGMEQAASDMDVELSFITLTNRNDWQEQGKLIAREMNNGAQAIILSAADSKMLAPAVETASKKAPVISIESNVDSPEIAASVVGQDYNMGKALGERIVYTGAYERKILILDSSLACSNIQEREKGLLDTLDSGKVKINRVLVTGHEDGLEEVTSIMKQQQPDILVALEPYTLELAAQAKESLNLSQLRVCGIGATGRFAPYMERGIIDTVIVQNDFNMGYLSIRAAMQKLKKTKEPVEAVIEFATISGYNMYSKEHQRLLFPFVR